MSDSCELRTVRSCTPKLETALQVLDRKLVHFMCDQGFITDEIRDSILTPATFWSDAARASEIVKWIRNRVKQNSSYYHLLLDWFRRGGELYRPIVETVNREFIKLSVAALQSQPTSTHNPLPQGQLAS